ncbi:MAG TPA: hypothetical protein VF577_00850, partial [Allosphingosinicella sp.]
MGGLPSYRALGAFVLSLASCAGGIALAQPAPRSLPEASSDPLRVDPATDPILQLGASRASFEEFRGVIAAAVARHPARTEQDAVTDEARAVLAE